MLKCNFFFTRVRHSESLQSHDRYERNTNKETVIFAEILAEDEYLVSRTNTEDGQQEN